MIATLSENSAAERCEALLHHLPPFPSVAMRLMRELSDDDAEVGDIVSLLRSDPAITAKLLAHANSALQGGSAPVKTLQQSLVKLGFQQTRRIVMRAATASYSGRAFRTIELQHCWRHSLACAELSSELAGKVGLDSDLAYTAGLMHDIGRLGLLVAHTDAYITMVHELEQSGPLRDSLFLLDRENQRFGVDHCEAGCWLMEHWNAPLELGAVAGRHHDKPDANIIGLVELVHSGCRLASALGFSTIDASAGTWQEVTSGIPDVFANSVTEDEDDLRGRIAAVIDAV